MAAQGQIQDMRVDNWGNYCLQRLHTMYEKGELCDLVLQFHTNQILKVHRVVVNLCTEYFSELERSNGLTSGALVLPEQIDYQALSTIIKFFYTGRLEVRGNQFNEIYKTVQILNITILLKLLDTRSGKPVQVQTKLQVADRVVSSNHTSQLDDAQAHDHLGNPTSTTIGRPISTKAVLARVQPHHLAKRLSPQILSTSNGKPVLKKRLPIWKERKFSPVRNTTLEASRAWSAKEEGPARPTRFEWPETDDDLQHLPIKDAPADSDSGRHIFDVIKAQNTVPIADKTNGEDEQQQSGEEVKTSCIEDPIERELAEMEGPAENETLTTVSTMEDPPKTDDSQIDKTNPTSELSSSVPNIVAESDKINSIEVAGPEVEPQNDVSSKVISEPDDVELIEEFQDPVSPDPNNLKSEAGNPLSHSRIISEVFKAYPDLVKDNRNIRLKIVQKNSPKKPEKLRDQRSKVSYIILKSTSSSDCVGSPVLTKRNSRLGKRALSTTSSFWDQQPNKIAKPADNLEGPWVCERCTTNSDVKEFETYFIYRKHLVEIHGDKIDARICEHCGHKASKRNLLLYHLYTKHGVQPRNCSFPRCDKCSYVGLTQALLTKHKQMHLLPSEHICQSCKCCFTSAALLRTHFEQNVGCAADCDHSCPICSKRYAKSINLKAHMRSAHKKQKQTTATLEFEASDPGDMVEESDTNPANSIVILKHDDDDLETEEPDTIPVQPPSSEAEAMSNVATSIAASLDLGEAEPHTALDSSSDQHTIYILETSGEPGHDNGLQEPADFPNVAPNGVVALEQTDCNTAETFIVQDVDGNKFEQVTAFDEYGKEIVYYQLTQPQLEHQEYSVEEGEGTHEIEAPATADVTHTAIDDASSLVNKDQ